MPGNGRNPPVERLADLADNHQVVDGPRLKRSEYVNPGLGQGQARVPESP
jgi:hypothetical protein